MKNIMKILLLLAVIILGTSFFANNVIAASVDSTTVSPDEITRKSTVTITANISGENIDTVNLSVEECSDETGTCFPPVLTTSMTKLSAGEYQGSVTLLNSKTTHIEYYFTITSNGVTQRIPAGIGSYRVNLSISNGNQNGTSGGNDKKTPGFEIITVLAAITVAILLYKRKRL